MTQEEQHLDVLSIFHYVVGGLAALFACFPLIHLAVGIMMIVGAFTSEGKPPLAIFGMFLILFASFFILCGWTLAALIVVAGRKLKKRRSRMFCLVMAGVECIFMPFGTVLGVLTILVLTKESVIALFDQRAGAA